MAKTEKSKGRSIRAAKARSAKMGEPDTGRQTGAPIRPMVSASDSDPIALLKADHREVKELFRQFEKEGGDAQKRDIAIAICTALKVHARLEEELFYPAAAALVDDPALIEEAQVEHASAKDLIAQIESGAPGEAFYDARVKVLSEYVLHHVAEEESEIFPQVRGSKRDLAALGQQMAVRKQELMLGFVVSNPVLGLA